MARQALSRLGDTINKSVSNSDEVRQGSWWSYRGRSDDMPASLNCFFHIFVIIILGTVPA